MIWRVITLLSLAACLLAEEHARSEQRFVQHFGPEHHGHHGELAHIGEKSPEHHDKYAWSFPSYEFAYKVKDPHTKDYKGHIEKRHGDEVVGEYWLLQPDGRKRIVKYRVDKDKGFQAHVRYEPDHDGHPSPPHKPVVEHVEEHKPEKHKPKHEEHKNVVEIRQHVHHPMPKHHHHEEHKPDHHEKPVHHVHVEHKFHHHEHEEQEPDQVEEEKPEEPKPEEHKPEESRPKYDEHKSVIEVRQRVHHLPLKHNHEKPIKVIHAEFKPLHHHHPLAHKPQHAEEHTREQHRPELRHKPEHRDRPEYRHRPEHRHRPEYRHRPEHLDKAIHHEENHEEHHDGPHEHRPHDAQRVPVHNLDPRPHYDIHHHDIHHNEGPHHLANWPHHNHHKPGRIIELWKNEAHRREDEHQNIPHVPLYKHYEPYYGHQRRYYRDNKKSKKNE